MSHFYEKLPDGTVEARHFVPMSGQPDKLRPTRITDVRKWLAEERKIVPSVTTILNVLDKAALTNWKIDQHLAWAYTLRHTDKDIDSWFREVKDSTELAMDKAPSAGSDFHDSMEKYLQDLLPKEHEHFNICTGAFMEIYKHTMIDPLEWRSEVKFVSGGYGGQTDLVCDSWVIDFKTKQTKDKFKPGKMVYDEHRMQLAAYHMGIGMQQRCANLFVCLEDGQVDFYEHSEKELERGWLMFGHCLGLWKLQNDQ